MKDVIRTENPVTRDELVDPVQGFGELIEAQGYSHYTQQIYRATADALYSKMIAEDISFSGLNDETVACLSSSIVEGMSVEKKRYSLYRLNRFRDYLIERLGAPARVTPKPESSPRACLQLEYEAYLKDQRGLSVNTIYHCVRTFDLFLTVKFGPGLGDLDTIGLDDVTNFILKTRAKDKAPRNTTVSTYLRSMFQFLFWSARTKRDLSKVVPRVRLQKPTSIPRYLLPDQVNRLVEAARSSTKAGRRNHAMLLLIARLGLRSTEVTAIELEDIDWRSGEIMIRGKGQLHDRMPLPVDVGEAIVDYIQNERRGKDRNLFVSVKPPFKRFKDAQILRWILNDAYDATGISPPQSYVGSHILRHSLATDMLRKGASLNEIGDVLRHRSPVTTTIYAQHDVDALRSVSRSWPTTEGEQ